MVLPANPESLTQRLQSPEVGFLRGAAHVSHSQNINVVQFHIYGLCENAENLDKIKVSSHACVDHVVLMEDKESLENALGYLLNLVPASRFFFDSTRSSLYRGLKMMERESAGSRTSRMMGQRNGVVDW